MKSSREQILAKLRGRQRPFPHVTPLVTYQPMTPLENDPDILLDRFIHEAQILKAVVHQAMDELNAIQTILYLLGEDSQILAWDVAHIPLPGLAQSLATARINIAQPNDPNIRVGITGANAALAATGSLVLLSGNGRYRTTSLLPPVHIAVITSNQILPTLESWMAAQVTDLDSDFRQSSNIVIISGASRTADIAMELILGMHGPRELHIIILET
jgi:L-lactate dehydrogenase complex protein LldG